MVASCKVNFDYGFYLILLFGRMMKGTAFDGAIQSRAKHSHHKQERTEDTINDDEGYERGQIDTFSSRIFFFTSRFLIADIPPYLTSFVSFSFLVFYSALRGRCL